MKTPGIQPAPLVYTADGIPWSAEHDDIYHPKAGALAQAAHVFLAGNGLPGRWQGRNRFVVLEAGFGLGNNFLATWDAWRRDAARCERLCFVSVERRPLRRDDLARVHRDPTLAGLAQQLVAAWPPLTPNLHLLPFDDGRVRLLLALGDVTEWLPALVARADAFYLDGFAPARNPAMWSERLFKALGRLAATDATAATWTAATAVRDALTTAGFEARLAPGAGGKRDITLARYAPRFVPRHSPSRLGGGVPAQRHALIVGAGLAGSACAWALAEQGWTSTVLDRHAEPAAEASGNPAGLFHGIVHGDDGVHARFNRAAALEAAKAVRQAVDGHGVRGEARGLLRLEATLDVASMQALLDRLGLPTDYVQALDAGAASAAAGLPLHQPCWFYPQGGWVDPAGLVRASLARAGERVRFQGNRSVHRLEPTATGWRLHDADDQPIGEAPTVVLANAGDALRLLGHPDWPIEAVRGQISIASADRASLPRLPVAGSGYLLPPVGDDMVFGATAQRGDADPGVRDEDHRHNLMQLQRLTGVAMNLELGGLRGRTAWRWVAEDRLPVVGAVPDAVSASRSARVLDQPRFVPRLPGLYVCTALGSRGINSSALAAQVLAALIAGAPVPLEADLLDAIDPARFIARAVRRQASARDRQGAG